MDQFVCSRCEQPIPLLEKAEHNDWHFAQDIQSQDQDDGGAAASASVNPLAPQMHTQKIDTKQDDASDSHPPPAYAPPSYPPPTSLATASKSSAKNPSNSLATRRHTNKVIEAAELRARDEVSPLSAPCADDTILTFISKKCKTRCRICNSKTASTTAKSSQSTTRTIIAAVLSTDIRP